jgi:ATP-dependent phosphofructokinase / diphosphate-dependent phosphofructokinase
MTAGGDCPGLNATIRAVAKTAIFRYGLEVVGVEDGFLGLIEGRCRPLSARDVSGILTRGGTVLGSNNRANPARQFVGHDPEGSPRYEDLRHRCVETYERAGLDALVVIGGDGTMSGASRLVECGINVIGIPKTIDNDLVGSEITIGFLTAVATATEAIDKLHSTAESHHRVMVCEVMGRNAGWIALTAGVASGSDVILIPELPFRWETIGEFIEARRRHGPGFAIVVVAEGARPRDGEQVVAKVDVESADPIRLGGIGAVVANEIAARTGLETRTTVLGHVQRGGAPIAADRVLATNFGFWTMTALMDGARNRLIVRQRQTFTDIDLVSSADRQRTVPLGDPLLDAARAVGTSLGAPLEIPSGERPPSVIC